MVKDEIDIVKEIITSMDVNIEMKAIVENGDNWDVTVCNVLHLNSCSEVVFDNVTYQVVSVDESFEGFTMSGTGDPVANFESGVKTIYTPPINFMYGTYSEINKEIVIKDHCKTMTYPIAFMLESPLRGELIYEKYSNNDNEIDCEIFFLQASSKKWNKGDHRHNATKGMRELAKVMQGYINKKRVLYENVGRIPHARLPEFSVYTNNQGKRTKIIDTLVSGFGTSFTLVTRKTHKCCKTLK